MELSKIISWKYPDKNEVHWDYIDTFPEIQALKSTEQSPVWHAEGNVWNHTKAVVEQAMKLAEWRALDVSNTTVLIAAALFHDIGKPATTFTGEDGKIHSYKHEIESEKITRKLLWEEDVCERERICTLVRLHMETHKLKNYWKFETFKKHLVDLMNKAGDDFYLLCLLGASDTLGAEYNSDDKKKDVVKYFMLCEFASHFHRKLDSDIKWLYHVYFPTNSTVTMLIGLPGSGKSTYASTSQFFGTTILSRDAIREELGMCKQGKKVLGTQSEENRISEIFDQRFINSLNKGEDILIDGINLKRAYRDHYKTLAKKYNVYWTYVYFQTENLSVNEERRPEMSHDLFMNMINNFDFPDRSEYDGLIIKNDDIRVK